MLGRCREGVQGSRPNATYGEICYFSEPCHALASCRYLGAGKRIGMSISVLFAIVVGWGAFAFLAGAVATMMFFRKHWSAIIDQVKKETQNNGRQGN